MTKCSLMGSFTLVYDILIKSSLMLVSGISIKSNIMFVSDISNKKKNQCLFPISQ